MENNNPKNLDEALTYLDGKISPEDRKYLQSGPDMSEFHHTVGRNMRNEWGLWSGGPLKNWFKSIGIYHPDDMSGIILKAFKRKIMNQPYDLKSDVKHYQDFWKRTEEREVLGITSIKMVVTKNEFGETEIKYES